MPTEVLDRLLKALRDGALFTPNGIGALLDLAAWAWKAYWEQTRPDLVPITATSHVLAEADDAKLLECCQLLKLRIPVHGDHAAVGINPLILALVRRLIELLLENVMSEAMVGVEEAGEDSLRATLAAIQHLEDLVESGSRS